VLKVLNIIIYNVLKCVCCSGGQLQYKYGGEYNKASILSWLAK